MSSYETFKDKLGVASRATLFEIVTDVPKAVKDAVNKGNPTDFFKYYVSSTQIPARTLGDIAVPYQGEDVNLAGDPVYEPLPCTFQNDTEMIVREIIEVWNEYIVNPRTNARAVPTQYKKDHFIYQVSNEIDESTGFKKRVRGWKLIGGYPSGYEAIEKNWESKDTVDIGTFTLRYDKFYRVDNKGNALVLQTV